MVSVLWLFKPPFILNNLRHLFELCRWQRWEIWKACMSKVIVSIRKKESGKEIKWEEIKIWGESGSFREIFVAQYCVTMTIYNPMSCPQNKRQRKGARQEAVWPRSAAGTPSQIYPLGNNQWKWGKVWWWDTGMGDGKARALLGCLIRELMRTITGFKYKRLSEGDGPACQCCAAW